MSYDGGKARIKSVLCGMRPTSDAMGAAEFSRLVLGQSVGELGTEEEDLRRVVDPYDDHNERSSRAVGGTYTGFAQVKADERLANREEKQIGRASCRERVLRRV